MMYTRGSGLILPRISSQHDLAIIITAKNKGKKYIYIIYIRNKLDFHATVAAAMV